jgi:hypothetical protein
MHYSPRRTVWVVYHAAVSGDQTPINAICEQHEWDALERSRPGQFVLVQSGITSEGQAEQLARGKSGDPRVYTRRQPQPAAPAAD